MKTRYLAWWMTAVIATGAAFLFYLSLRFENVRLSYEVEDARREHRRLSEIQRLVALETQTLRERQRVHAIAERSLGMAAPELGRVIVMADGVMDGSKNARGAGRAR